MMKEQFGGHGGTITITGGGSEMYKQIETILQGIKEQGGNEAKEKCEEVETIIKDIEADGGKAAPEKYGKIETIIQEIKADGSTVAKEKYGEIETIIKMIKGSGSTGGDGSIKCTYSCIKDGQCKVEWTKGLSKGSGTCGSKKFGGTCSDGIPADCKDCHGNVDKPCGGDEKSGGGGGDSSIKCKYSCIEDGKCNVEWTKGTSKGSGQCMPKTFGGECSSGLPDECKDCHGNVDKPC